MFCFLQVFCSLFSGVILSLAIPNEFLKFGSPLLGIFALVPLYYAIRQTKSYKTAFWLFWIHGAITHLISSFWLGNFHGFAIFTLGASDIGTAFIEAFVGLIIFFPFSKNQDELLLQEKAGIKFWNIPLRIIWFSSIYVIYEWCKSTGFLAYPWGTVSMTSFPWPIFTQIADITGPYGITFIFVLIASFVAEGLYLITTNKLSFGIKNNVDSYIQFSKLVLVIVVFVGVYGIYQYVKPRQVIKKMNTVLVQQNLDPWGGNDREIINISKRLTEEKILDLKEQGKKPDLVVWSEGVLSKKFPNAQSYYEKIPEDESLMNFIKRMNVPFIIGGSVTIDRENHKYGNAALLINKNGKYTGSYIKLHLVPFAEAIPGVEYEIIRKLIKKIAGFSYGWTQGNKYTLFEIPISDRNTIDTSKSEIISLEKTTKQKKKPSVLISTPICFDDAFGEVCRGLYKSGCEVFVNITNDSWSQTESAEYQHFVVASLRAIEYRTTLVRATNSGYTVVVDPSGKILFDLPLFVEDALGVTVPVYERIETVYSKFGNWLPYSIMVLSLIYIILVRTIEKESVITEISVDLVKNKRKRKNIENK